MTTIAEQVAAEHSGYSYREERGGDVCTCGAKVYTGYPPVTLPGVQGFVLHVAEVTERAVRAAVAAEMRDVQPRAECGCDLSVGPNAVHLLDHHPKEAALTVCAAEEEALTYLRAVAGDRTAHFVTVAAHLAAAGVTEHGVQVIVKTYGTGRLTKEALDLIVSDGIIRQADA